MVPMSISTYLLCHRQSLLPHLPVVVWDAHRWDDVLADETININNNRNEILTAEYTNLKYQMNNLTEEVKD